MNLFIKPVPPATDDPALKAFYQYWAVYELARAKLLEASVLGNVSPFVVGTTTVDLGGAEIAPASAAAASTAFTALSLPNTANTTSNAFQTALNYTGSGVLSLVVVMTQLVALGSTATGMSVQITIDGNVLFTGSVTTAVNHMRAIVGRLSIIDTANNYMVAQGHPIGLTFLQSCKLEFKSAVNGQGVTIGWDVLKLS
ncbi:MAG TPA: hypothetical protein VHV32_18890 [Candidatus Angelobacter sp.]|jgi:hypothetical protein|nr:hypothetical protein [Candidatus Angelobacter sp.]